MNSAVISVLGPAKLNWQALVTGATDALHHGGVVVDMVGK
jgi:hypothetical protein